MRKQELLNLLERFDALLNEVEQEKPNIYMALEITVKSGFLYHHYIYVCDKETGKDFLCCIKGFNKIIGKNEVETFNDVLEVLEREENE